LAIITGELQTASFITSALEGNIPPYLMPTIIFVLSALIAFSTGSSWSTMAILYPIAIPSTWAICIAAGIDPEHSLEILLNVISTVLAASVLGDHCSPISDTTILSSLATDCNHIDHVRTQMPYALTVGVAAILCNTISTILGGGWLISLLLISIAVALLYFFVRKVGKEIVVESN
ncbi:MAG: Na+/H+ antiporter NhaC family protein, partial [Bacteroidota bacterium]